MIVTETDMIRQVQIQASAQVSQLRARPRSQVDCINLSTPVAKGNCLTLR